MVHVQVQARNVGIARRDWLDGDGFGEEPRSEAYDRRVLAGYDRRQVKPRNGSDHSRVGINAVVGGYGLCSASVHDVRNATLDVSVGLMWRRNSRRNGLPDVDSPTSVSCPLCAELVSLDGTV